MWPHGRMGPPVPSRALPRPGDPRRWSASECTDLTRTWLAGVNRVCPPRDHQRVVNMPRTQRCAWPPGPRASNGPPGRCDDLRDERDSPWGVAQRCTRTNLYARIAYFYCAVVPSPLTFYVGPPPSLQAIRTRRSSRPSPRPVGHPQAIGRRVRRLPGASRRLAERALVSVGTRPCAAWDPRRPARPRPRRRPAARRRPLLGPPPLARRSAAARVSGRRHPPRARRR